MKKMKNLDYREYHGEEPITMKQVIVALALLLLPCGVWFYRAFF